jgi:hypothetical protein
MDSFGNGATSVVPPKTNKDKGFLAPEGIDSLLQRFIMMASNPMAYPA